MPKRNVNKYNKRLSNLFERAHITERSASSYGPTTELIRRDMVTGERTVHSLDFSSDYTITLYLKFRKAVDVRDVAESFRNYARCSIQGIVENIFQSEQGLVERLGLYEIGTEEKRTYVRSMDGRSDTHREIEVVSHSLHAENSFLCYVQDVLGVNVLHGKDEVHTTHVQGGRTKKPKKRSPLFA